METAPEANLLQAVSEKTRSDLVLIGFFEFSLYFFISLKGHLTEQYLLKELNSVLKYRRGCENLYGDDLKMTKRKLYWILLIPSVFIAIMALILLPEAKKNYLVFIPLIFWIVYYGVIKIMDLKTKKENDDV